MDFEYRVLGIDCANCALEIENKINKLDFVEEASLNFLTQKLDISFTDDVICDDAIKKVIEIIKDEENDAIIEEI